jgi:ABC-type branched-subunit amino acid transport system substrate-binding protein
MPKDTQIHDIIANLLKKHGRSSACCLNEKQADRYGVHGLHTTTQLS